MHHPKASWRVGGSFAVAQFNPKLFPTNLRQWFLAMEIGMIIEDFGIVNLKKKTIGIYFLQSIFW